MTYATSAIYCTAPLRFHPQDASVPPRRRLPWRSCRSSAPRPLHRSTRIRMY
jgi:hypothetical protein